MPVLPLLASTTVCPGLECAGLLRCLNDAEGQAVLDGAERVEGLDLDVELDVPGPQAAGCGPRVCGRLFQEYSRRVFPWRPPLLEATCRATRERCRLVAVCDQVGDCDLEWCCPPRYLAPPRASTGSSRWPATTIPFPIASFISTSASRLTGSPGCRRWRLVLS